MGAHTSDGIWTQHLSTPVELEESKDTLRSNLPNSPTYTVLLTCSTPSPAAALLLPAGLLHPWGHLLVRGLPKGSCIWLDLARTRAVHGIYDCAGGAAAALLGARHHQVCVSRQLCQLADMPPLPPAVPPLPAAAALANNAVARSCNAVNYSMPPALTALSPPPPSPARRPCPPPSPKPPSPKPLRCGYLRHSATGTPTMKQHPEGMLGCVPADPGNGKLTVSS